jgi:hypothetical protein
MPTAILRPYGPEGPTKGRLHREVGVESGIALPELSEQGYFRVQLIHKNKIHRRSEKT